MSIGRIVNSPSRSFFVVLVSFCVGVVLGSTELFWISQLPFIVAVLLAITVLLKDKEHKFILVLLIAALLGVFRFQQSVIPEHIPTVLDHTEKNVRIEGVVREEVQRRINSQQVVLKDIHVAGVPTQGDVLVRFPLYPTMQYGDELAFNCRMQKPEPFNGFRYDDYLRSKGILATCGFPQFTQVQSAGTRSFVGAVLHLKEQTKARLQRISTEPQASFLFSLLFGGDAGLSNSTKEQFARTGTSHVLAASGFNVSLFTVVLLGWLLTTRIKREHALWITGGLLIVYVVLAGATPSVIRAALMASMFLVQVFVRRKAFMPNILAITLALMLLANPRVLLHDVGFQLSFVATASLLIAMPRCKKWFSFLPNKFGLQEAFASTVVASAATLPIILWHFGSISLVSPITNLLILPLIPYAMAFTIIALVLSSLSLLLAKLALIPAWLITTAILRIVDAFSASVFAIVEPDAAKYIAATLVGIFVTLFIYAKTFHQKKGAQA